VIYDKDALRIEFDVPDSLARHIKKLAEIKANDEEKITENINHSKN
jgi:hypothetical protein